MLSSSGLKRRSDFIQAVRLFFLKNKYIEVDTPIRLPVLLPEAEIQPFISEDWWLQTSPELCMKRLLTRGVPQLFQLCHCFRKGELGRFHEPEFTLLEWYHTGWDYQDLMLECERLLQELAVACSDFPGVSNQDTLCYHNHGVSLSSPWIRMSVEEAFLEYADISAVKAIEDDRFEEVLVSKVEPHLGWDKPVFLYDYPVELGSLARRKAGALHLAERFELYLFGIELANGFSELIDAGEQRARFFKELTKMRRNDRQGEMPEKFLQDLEMMEETAGIALGIDRLLMLFLKASRLSDVLPFSRNELCSMFICILSFDVILCCYR
jgi:lysyl-tRNA synthetase class 2